MAAAVRFADAAVLLAAGFVFLALSLALGRGFARAGLVLRAADGSLRKGNAAVISLAFAVLVFATSMTLWWLDRFHPALIVFFTLGGVLLGQTSRARAPAAKAGGSSGAR